MKKSVISVDVKDAKSKKAAIQAVSGFKGIESLLVDFKKNTLTVVGDVDPCEVVRKLRKLKLFDADIKTVGPIEEKGDNKKDDKSKQQQEMEQIMRDYYKNNYPNYRQPYYYPPPYASIEDDPRTCVIC